MGIMLALEALGIGQGDEVIVPTYTFSSTAMMVHHLQAKPVFCDIDPNTLNIDVSKIESLITKNTKAIMPVHFAGLAVDMDAIYKLAEQYNLAVIDDAAHCLPTVYKGKMVGNIKSEATIFSFYATKTITTGEGGMIITSNKELAKRARIMRLHGISRDVFDRYTSKGAKWYYQIVAPGYKCNLTDVAAAIGIEQLKKAMRFYEKRKYIATRYNDAFKDLPLTLPPGPQGDDIHSWHLYVIRVKDRDAFIQKMDEKGVGCSVHFIPLHLQPYWAESLQYNEGDFPGAESVFSEVVSLPLYTKMTDADIEKVIAAVKEILC
jgi:dTDP-4-amino-4,6-dideoxygalactose transaminase